MTLSATTKPQTDPTAIFELYRGSFGSELLTAAVAHLGVFEILAERPLEFEVLRSRLKLDDRPAVVLITALRAMQLLHTDDQSRLALTDLAHEHLRPGAQFDVGDYIGLAAHSPGVLKMVERLQTNLPAGTGDDEDGAAFIYRDGIDSAMEQAASTRHLTLALAGRAKNVAPVLAERISMTGVDRLLDVAGGSGIYSIAFLQANPDLTAVVVDRPEVLRVAAEFGCDYGVSDRLELVEGDMFRDPVPQNCQAILLSNVLHDWDIPECQSLLDRCADALSAGGRLLIHDVYLNDDLDGPLAVALYSANLFAVTEGRAYSAAEYRSWLAAVGLECSEIIPTLIHCGVLTGTKSPQD